MQDKTIIDSIRDFIFTCEFLQKWRVSVDYLGLEMSYSINPLPCDPVVKRYVDGGAVKQFQFAFTSKESYDSDARTCIENSGFYQRFEEWMEEKDRRGEYPDLGRSKTPTEISIMQKGYLYDVDTDLGQYEIQCKLEYEEN